jgi:hypothetical protein
MLHVLDDIPDRTVQIGGPVFEAKVKKALLGWHAASPDSRHACKFWMERANMQPASAEWHARFDHPGAELVEKFAIVGDKAALLRQPFRKASRLIRWSVRLRERPSAGSLSGPGNFVHLFNLLAAFA